jgi:hypothetical protein
LTSERVNKLSWGAECFYRRLMSVADDFGRYYAHPALLLSACYPLKTEEVKKSEIEAWLKEVIDAELITVYCVKSKKYVLVLDFRQQIRNKKSKFPDPCLSNDEQLRSKCIASAHVDGDVFGDVFGDEDGDGDGDGDGDECGDGAPKTPGAPLTRFCRRDGKKVPAERHGSSVLLTREEYWRMVFDWGQKFTTEAIAEYDGRYPNSPAIRKHTDHNRGIRDYVNRGYICAGKTPRPQTTTSPKQRPDPTEIGTPEERAEALKNPFAVKRAGKRGGDPQSVGEILTEMTGGP